jgi:hypothetical protein
MLPGKRPKKRHRKKPAGPEPPTNPKPFKHRKL